MSFVETHRGWKFTLDRCFFSPFLLKRYWVFIVLVEATVDKKAFYLILVTSLVWLWPTRSGASRQHQNKQFANPCEVCIYGWHFCRLCYLLFNLRWFMLRMPEVCQLWHRYYMWNGKLFVLRLSWGSRQRWPQLYIRFLEISLIFHIHRYMDRIRSK